MASEKWDLFLGALSDCSKHLSTESRGLATVKLNFQRLSLVFEVFNSSTPAKGQRKKKKEIIKNPTPNSRPNCTRVGNRIQISQFLSGFAFHQGH